VAAIVAHACITLHPASIQQCHAPGSSRAFAARAPRPGSAQSTAGALAHGQAPRASSLAAFRARRAWAVSRRSATRSAFSRFRIWALHLDRTVARLSCIVCGPISGRTGSAYAMLRHDTFNSKAIAVLEQDLAIGEGLDLAHERDARAAAEPIKIAFPFCEREHCANQRRLGAGYRTQRTSARFHLAIACASQPSNDQKCAAPVGASRQSPSSRIALSAGKSAKAWRIFGRARAELGAVARENRTSLPSLTIWKRKPSHFGSCIQSSPVGGVTREDGDRGRIKERRTEGQGELFVTKHCHRIGRHCEPQPSSRNFTGEDQCPSRHSEPRPESDVTKEIKPKNPRRCGSSSRHCLACRGRSLSHAAIPRANVGLAEGERGILDRLVNPPPRKPRNP
jgi:hypothetical protein